jgi:hypothetical protein
MKPSALLILSAGVLAGCTSGPFAFWRDAARERQPDATSAMVLQPSVVISSPPATPKPMEADAGLGDTAFKEEQARALQGDKDSAYRVAQMFRDGSNGVARDEQKMVRWLRHASELDHGVASYQLYLHYLGRGLDRDAVRFENRAIRQGFVPPPRLDPRRG